MSAPADPTTRVSRVDDAYERIKGEILSNRMPPGFQATEMEIAASLDMSRTPVHGALLRLAQEGLITLRPRRGATVLPIVPDDMREIYEILTVLESEAGAALAERRLAADELAPLADATTRMERSLSADDLDGWAVHDDRFHRALLELHGNKRLARIVNTLFDQVYRSRMIALRMRPRPVRSTQEHREVIAALGEGDADAVRSTLRRHRKRTATELIAVLENFRLGQL